MKRGWLAALPLLAGCAYYNTMWRAEQFAKEARGMEARGRVAEAKIAWLRATIKAESVLARHPGSRWADDALVLKGEGLARSGDCARAEGPLEDARRTVVEAALLERASLAAAECALQAGNPARAAQLAADVAGSRHADRRAVAAYLEGRAAWARGDAALALDRYARSPLTGAALARIRALLELGRAPEALDQIAAAGGRAVPAAEWTAMIDAVARAAGPETASLALDRLLGAAPPLTSGARGRLLVADGDRLLATSLADAAAARYRAVRELVPDSAEGTVAVVRLARTRAARASDTATLRAVLNGLGRDPDDARALAALLRRVLGPHPDVATEFRAAELARDSLGTRPLAGALFLALARRAPESIFAPKALVAALAADAEPRDSILGVLRAAYPSSPYTLALEGAAGPAYTVAEDSLAQALGLSVSTVLATPGQGVPAPVPGRRGPFLDVVFRASSDGVAVTVPDPERPRVRDRERIR